MIFSQNNISQVVAGAHHRIAENGHQVRLVKSVEHHKDHNTPHFNNDVAIVTVLVPFNFTDPHVQPLEMFLSSDAPIPVGTICNSTGWGAMTGVGPGFGANALQWTQLPIRSAEYCESVFTSYLDDTMIGAGNAEHTPCNVSFV